jgi:hypothetical protein
MLRKEFRSDRIKSLLCKNISIFEYNKGNYIDLDNMGIEDNIVAGQVTVDTRQLNKAALRIQFGCNLNYSLSLTEQLNLLFKLYRKDQEGTMTELTSTPYTISLDGQLGTESEFITISLQKNESFVMEYVDDVKGGKQYTYVVQVTLIYSSVDESSIQCGYITVTGQGIRCTDKQG